MVTLEKTIFDSLLEQEKPLTVEKISSEITDYVVRKESDTMFSRNKMMQILEKANLSLEQLDRMYNDFESDFIKQDAEGTFAGMLLYQAMGCVAQQMVAAGRSLSEQDKLQMYKLRLLHSGEVRIRNHSIYKD